jgi:hypothetical protein
MTRNTPEEYRNCAHCGKPFLVRGFQTKTDRKKYCSKPCKHHGLAIHDLARTMSPEEAAWFAGVFDGEGWISWPDRSCLSTFRIGIASTSLPFIERICEVTGTGRFRERPVVNEHHSTSWVWYCFSSNARTVLMPCLPWLIIKKHPVEVALGLVAADIAPITPRGAAQQHHKAA